MNTQGVEQTAQDVTQQSANGLESILGSGIFIRILKIGVAVGVVIIGMLISKIIAVNVRNKFFNKPEEDSESTRKVGKLVENITYYVLIIFSVVLGLEIVGFDVGVVLGGVAFGVGMAFKDVLSNMIAGIMLLTTKEIKIGDIVEIGGYFGKIEEIAIRYTTIRTFDLRQIVLPNSMLVDSAIKTFSSEKVIKLKIVIGIHYDTEIPFAIEVIKAAINNLPFIAQKEKTSVFFKEFGESRIFLTCFFRIDPKIINLQETQIETVLDKVNFAINEYLKSNKIVIPYSYTTIVIE